MTLNRSKPSIFSRNIIFLFLLIKLSVLKSYELKIFLKIRLFSSSILSLVNTDYSTLNNETDAANRNFNRWQIFGIYIWPNSFIGNSYYEEINFLKDWISQRTAWLDISINEL